MHALFEHPTTWSLISTFDTISVIFNFHISVYRSPNQTGSNPNIYLSFIFLLKTSRQNILTRDQISGSGFFTGGGKLMWHQPVGSNAVGCSSLDDAVIDFFAAYTTALQWLTTLFNEPNCSFPSEDLWTCGSLALPESTLQLASRLVQPFLQGSRTWPTDRHTDHVTPSVAIGRI